MIKSKPLVALFIGGDYTGFRYLITQPSYPFRSQTCRSIPFNHYCAHKNQEYFSLIKEKQKLNVPRGTL